MKAEYKRLSEWEIDPNKFQIPFSLATPKHGKLNKLLNLKQVESVPTPSSQKNQLSHQHFRKSSSYGQSPLSRSISSNSRPGTAHKHLKSLVGGDQIILNANPSFPNLKPTYFTNPVQKKTMQTLLYDPHIKNKVVVQDSQLQLQASKKEDQKSYFILKNVQRLQKSYSNVKFSHSQDNIKQKQTNIDQKILQNRQKNLFEMYVQNERKNLTVAERDQFWKFLSSNEVNAMLDFRTIYVEAPQLEMAYQPSHELIKEKRKLRKMFNEMESVK